MRYRPRGWAAVAAVAVAAGAAAADDAAPIAVSQRLPPAVTQGQGFTADVFVTNVGGRAVDDVRLAGSWSAGFRLAAAVPPAADGPGDRAEWAIGRLEPGSARLVRLTFAASDQVPGAEFRSAFEATFRGSRADVAAVPVHRPALALDVAGPAVAVVGQPVRVRVAVRNPGAADVRGVTLSSDLPDGVSHPGGAALVADLPVVRAGAAEDLPLDLTPTRAGDVRVVFKVAGGGAAAAEQAVHLTAIDPRLEVGLTGPRRLPAGWPVTYELTVRNAGDQPVPGAQLEVAVPVGFDDLRADGGAMQDPAGRRLVWQAGDLRPGEVRTLSWLAAKTRPGEYDLTAVVRVGGATVRTAQWRTALVAADGR